MCEEFKKKHSVNIVSQLYIYLQLNMQITLTHLVSCGIKLDLHASIARFKVYHSYRLTSTNTNITYNISPLGWILRAYPSWRLLTYLCKLIYGRSN